MLSAIFSYLTTHQNRSILLPYLPCFYSVCRVGAILYQKDPALYSITRQPMRFPSIQKLVKYDLVNRTCQLIIYSHNKISVEIVKKIGVQ